MKKHFKKKWTKDEIMFLLINKNKYSYKEMANKFNVTINSISKTIQRYNPKYKISNHSLLKKLEIFNQNNINNNIIFNKKLCVFLYNNEVQSLISVNIMLNEFFFYNKSLLN